MKCPKCGNSDFYNVEYIKEYDDDSTNGIDKVFRTVKATCCCGEVYTIKEVYTFSKATIIK